MKKRWRGERASYSSTKKKNYRSNKYRTRLGSDKSRKSSGRKKVWVGGYIKKNGTRVRGHYRKNS